MFELRNGPGACVLFTPCLRFILRKLTDIYEEYFVHTCHAYIIRRNLRASFYRETALAVASGGAYKLNK